MIARIADVRKTLAGKSYSKTLPVGTADAGSQITSTLSQAADYVRNFRFLVIMSSMLTLNIGHG